MTAKASQKANSQNPSKERERKKKRGRINMVKIPNTKHTESAGSAAEIIVMVSIG